MKRRIVITGIGPVTSLGIGKDKFWENLLNGLKPKVKKIPQIKVQTKSKFYVPFPKFSLKDFAIPKYYRFLQPEDKFLLPCPRLQPH